MPRNEPPGSENPLALLDTSGQVAVDLACLHCGHNLRGLAGLGACPGCARPVQDSVQGIHLRLDFQSRVAMDLLCVQCGYNLRGLAADGRCPECAHVVLGSARGFYLGHASPAWVQKLARGLLWLLIALGGWVVVVFGFYAAFILPMAFASAGPPATAVFAAHFICNLVFLAMAVVGLVWVTAREPAAVGRAEGLTARRMVRICLCALPLMLASSFALTFLSRFWVLTSTLAVVSIVCIAGFWIAWGLALPLALLRHLMALLRRVPSPGLITFAKVELWSYLACVLFFITGYAVMFVTVMLPMRRAMAAMAATWPASAPVVTTNPVTTMTSAPGGLAVSVSTTYIVTAAGPNGPVTITGTNPATMPAVTPMMPPQGAGFYAGAVMGGLGGCGSLLVIIGGYVFLILAQRTLTRAARQAAALRSS